MSRRLDATVPLRIPVVEPIPKGGVGSVALKLPSWSIVAGVRAMLLGAGRITVWLAFRPAIDQVFDVHLGLPDARRLTVTARVIETRAFDAPGQPRRYEVVTRAVGDAHAVTRAVDALSPR